MTQPALSRHIKFIEQSLGAQVLSRSTHHVEMTNVGRVFATEAAKIVAQFEQSLAIVRACPGVSQRTLSIGLLGEATRSFLSAYLLEYTGKHPKVAIECVDGDLDTIVNRVGKGEYDLAFVIRPRDAPTPERLSCFSVASDPLCIVVNRNHSLAGRRTVTVAEVAEWPLISLNRQIAPVAFEYNTFFFSRHGIEYKPWKECPNVASCCFNIEFDERAVTLIPLHWRSLVGANSTLIMFEESDCVFEVDLLWDSMNVNPSLNGFISGFREFSRIWDWQPKTLIAYDPWASVGGMVVDDGKTASSNPTVS